MRPEPSPITHALSFDIEDWFHIVEIPAVENPDLWPDLHKQSIVERYTDLILNVCADHRVTATFFILGWVAQRHPTLVRRIADAGHEIATHSYWHRKVYELSPAQFREDIERSLAVLHAAAPGVSIQGFRAPSFSITKGCEWAFDVLLDCGLTYDASLFPAARGHGGYACTPGPHTLTAPSGRPLRELPMSIAPVGIGPFRKAMCYSGGGYLRLLPGFMIEQGLASEARAGRSTVVYLHPRDFAPDCPRPAMPIHRRFKCYVGIRSTERKLRTLLAHHRWTTCAAILKDALHPPAPTADNPGPAPSTPASATAA